MWPLFMYIFTYIYFIYTYVEGKLRIAERTENNRETQAKRMLWQGNALETPPQFLPIYRILQDDMAHTNKQKKKYTHKKYKKFI